MIDMQNDYLWGKRMSKFTYDTELIVSNVNKTIHQYQNECDIIYISHLIQNIFTNRLLFAFSIQGTEGAELYNGLDVVSDLKFDKYFSNAYQSSKFKRYMLEKQYDEVMICGLDFCGCVYHTALGALKEHHSVSIISSAIACRYSKEKFENTKKKLIKLGVRFIS